MPPFKFHTQNRSHKIRKKDQWDKKKNLGARKIPWGKEKIMGQEKNLGARKKSWGKEKNLGASEKILRQAKKSWGKKKTVLSLYQEEFSWYQKKIMWVKRSGAMGKVVLTRDAAPSTWCYKRPGARAVALGAVALGVGARRLQRRSAVQLDVISVLSAGKRKK